MEAVVSMVAVVTMVAVVMCTVDAEVMGSVVVVSLLVGGASVSVTWCSLLQRLDRQQTCPCTVPQVEKYCSSIQK